MSPNDTTVKCCSKCKREFPATTEYFPPRSDSKDGLRGQCRECTHQRRLKYYSEHHEAALAYSKQWTQNNKEIARQSNLRWARANKERVNQRRRELWKENPERYRGYSREWYQRNKAQVAAATHRWASSHKEERRESVRRYSKTAKGTIATKAAKHARRARKAGNGGSFTAADLSAILAAQTDKRGRLRCWWCGKPVKGTPHLDHKVALAVGGSNDAGNLCYSCAKCNLSKGTKSPSDMGRLL